MTLRALPRTLPTLLLALALAAAAALLPARPGPAPAARAAATLVTGASHPYSDPVWYPIRNTVYLDCVLTNPGCAGTHSLWTMDMVLETLGQPSVPAAPGVYAMGAGILHIQNPRGVTCSDGGVNDFGTTAWIDHGGGIVSRYGHLARILYPEGTLVAAGQEFAIMGTTGKGGNCAVPYLDFQLRRGGVNGPRIPMPTLKVCDGSAVRTWPTDLVATDHVRPAPKFAPSTVHSRYTSFNDVPQRTIDFPATSGACIPAGVPATPARPAGVRLTPSGRGQLTVSWAPPTDPQHVSRIQVQLSEYHPSTHSWDFLQNEEVRTVAGTATRYEYGGLVSGHRYRATVAFRNAVGFGRSAGTAAVVSMAPPATPASRGASATRTGRTATLRFAWTRPASYGTPVTGFVLQLRRVPASGTPGAWRSVRLGPGHLSWTATGQPRGTVQLRVQAISAAGASRFLTRTVRS